MEEFLKQALSHIPQFIARFVNLIIAPRATETRAFAFDQYNIAGALAFFGIAMLVAQVLKAPMLPSAIPLVPHLAADAVWKMVVVLIEAVIIATVMRLIGNRFALGSLIVANCYYFGALSVLSHLILLSGGQLINKSIAGVDVFYLYHLFGFGLIMLWMLLAWSAYAEFSEISRGRAVLALALVCCASLPALLFASLLRDALVPRLYPHFHY